MRPALHLVILAFAALTLCSCHTTPLRGDSGTETTTPEAESAPAPAPAEFRPVIFYARLVNGDGPHPDLYSHETHAIWISPEVLAMKRQMAAEAGESIEPEADTAVKLIGANYIVFECFIESMFADASIAYDAVGLRNVEVYIETPNGGRVAPVQRVLGTALDESQAGAIKKFARTSLLVFPKIDVMSQQPAIDAGAAGIRLVLSGFDSTFFFEWPAVAGEEESSRFREVQGEAVKALKTGFSEFYGRLKFLAHTFD